MKIKLTLIVATHETKYGVDTYSRIVKKSEKVEDIIDELRDECEYDENNPDSGEYFDYTISQIIIDTDDHEIVT